jgi:site-specific DNA-methyltransferase (adenine-specific)
MRELVSLFSDPDELILDPFSGSGSTGVACNQLGRRFLGFELNREYFDIACRRLRGDEAKPRPEQPSLFGRTA